MCCLIIMRYRCAETTRATATCYLESLRQVSKIFAMSLIIALIILGGAAQNLSKPACEEHSCPMHLEFHPNFPTQQLTWSAPPEKSRPQSRRNSAPYFVKYTVWYKIIDEGIRESWEQLPHCSDLRSTKCTFAMDGLLHKLYSVQAVYEECECNRSATNISIWPLNFTFFPEPSFNVSVAKGSIFINLEPMKGPTRSMCLDFGYQVQITSSPNKGHEIAKSVKAGQTEIALMLKDTCKSNATSRCCIRMSIVCNDWPEDAFGQGNWSDWNCVDVERVTAAQQLPIDSHNKLLLGLLLAVSGCCLVALFCASYKGFQLYQKIFNKHPHIPASLATTMESDFPRGEDEAEHSCCRESYEILTKTTNENYFAAVSSLESCRSDVDLLLEEAHGSQSEAQEMVPCDRHSSIAAALPSDDVHVDPGYLYDADNPQSTFRYLSSLTDVEEKDDFPLSGKNLGIDDDQQLWLSGSAKAYGNMTECSSSLLLAPFFGGNKSLNPPEDWRLCGTPGYYNAQPETVSRFTVNTDSGVCFRQSSPDSQYDFTDNSTEQLPADDCSFLVSAPRQHKVHCIDPIPPNYFIVSTTDCDQQSVFAVEQCSQNPASAAEANASCYVTYGEAKQIAAFARANLYKTECR